jgi:hypothetical protein
MCYVPHVKARRRPRRKKGRGTTLIARLIQQGRATEPVGDLLEIGLPEGKVSRTLGEALEAVREDRL